MEFKAFIYDGHCNSFVCEILPTTSLAVAKKLIADMYNCKVFSIGYLESYNWIIENTDAQKELFSTKCQNYIRCCLLKNEIPILKDFLK